MAREVHPSAEDAARLIERYRIVPNIDPRGRTVDEVVDIAEQHRSMYGECMRVMEILNRDPARTALKAIAPLADRGFYPILGSAVLKEHVDRAINDGAVGYVSFGGIDEPVVRAAIDREDGARLAIPTVSSPETYCAALRAKMQASLVEYPEELPDALQWYKVFPGKENHLWFPEEVARESFAAGDILRRILGTTASTHLNFKMVVTGHDRAEESLPWLRMKQVGRYDIAPAIGPAISTPEETFAWLEAIQVVDPDSPLQSVLRDAQRDLKNIRRLPAHARRRSKQERASLFRQRPSQTTRAARERK